MSSPMEVAAPPPVRWVRLGLSMIVLGAWRGYPDFVALLRFATVNTRQVLTDPQSIPWIEFAGVLWAAWPIFLGVALAITRSPRLLRAAVITALAMAFERAATLAAGILIDSALVTSRFGTNSTIGPILRGPWQFVAPTLATIAWFAVALALSAAVPTRPGAEVSRASRRGETNRLVGFASGIFALVILGVTSWNTYLDAVERLPGLRKLVLGDTPRSRVYYSGPETAEARAYREASFLLSEGQRLQAEGKTRDAHRAYLRAVNRYEGLMQAEPGDGRLSRQLAFAANNLAWSLATSADVEARDPEAAVALARKAVAVDPTDGNALNTLGAALFRAGDGPAALATFADAMRLRDGGDSFDWYFVAMLEAGRDNKAEALALYERAASWDEKYRPADPELHRFRIEAAERLGLPAPPPIPPPKPIARVGPGEERVVGNVPGALRGDPFAIRRRSVPTPGTPKARASTPTDAGARP